uniref:Focal adhesion kinase 1 n=1 Tax=Caenorhabditis tropicalis TaxID=1561998 RepID=A0A1I7UJJ0_9PELO
MQTVERKLMDATSSSSPHYFHPAAPVAPEEDGKKENSSHHIKSEPTDYHRYSPDLKPIVHDGRVVMSGDMTHFAKLLHCVTDQPQLMSLPQGVVPHNYTYHDVKPHPGTGSPR